MRIRKQNAQKQTEYQRARRRALARKPFLKADGKYLSRAEVHERMRLRESE
jgi:hypothetical protein